MISRSGQSKTKGSNSNDLQLRKKTGANSLRRSAEFSRYAIANLRVCDWNRGLERLALRNEFVFLDEMML